MNATPLPALTDVQVDDILFLVSQGPRNTARVMREFSLTSDQLDRILTDSRFVRNCNWCASPQDTRVADASSSGPICQVCGNPMRGGWYS